MTVKYASIALLCTLAGCKGTTLSATFTNATVATENLVNQIEASPPADPAQIPTTGTANYTGSAIFGTSSDVNTLLANPELVSELAVTADFQNKRVSGSFSQFEEASGATVTGSLALSNSDIPDETFSANAAGILRIGGTDQAITGAIFGEFLGSSQDLLGGGFAGSRTIGTSTTAFYGTFGATKD